MQSRWLIIIGGILAAAAGALAFITMPQEKPEALVYDPPRALAPFKIESTATGGTVDNEALKGQWTLLFTGYTYCPDICPTTLSSLKTILPQLQAHADVPVKVWMISVTLEFTGALNGARVTSKHFVGGALSTTTVHFVEI